ncbi:MAG: EamA family transporter, partial [Bacteroidia bacterium]
MNFSGELAAILTTLVWSIGIFPFTEASKRLGSNPLNHFRLVVAIILLWLLLAAYYGLGFSDLFLRPDLKQWLWLGLSGIMGLTIGDYFAFRSMELLGARLS